MTAKTEIADQIRKYKAAGGFSIRQLSNLCNVQKSSVTNWMAGYTRPTIDHLVTLAGVFEIPPEDRAAFYESATKLVDK